MGERVALELKLKDLQRCFHLRKHLHALALERSKQLSVEIAELETAKSELKKNSRKAERLKELKVAQLEVLVIATEWADDRDKYTHLIAEVKERLSKLKKRRV